MSQPDINIFGGNHVGTNYLHGCSHFVRFAWTGATRYRIGDLSQRMGGQGSMRGGALGRPYLVLGGSIPRRSSPRAQNRPSARRGRLIRHRVAWRGRALLGRHPHDLTITGITIAIVLLVGLIHDRHRERGGEPALAVQFALGLSDGLGLRNALNALGGIF